MILEPIQDRELIWPVLQLIFLNYDRLQKNDIDMNKLKLYFILTLLLLGCADQLQEDSINPNANTPPTFFKTEADAVSSINAVYNALIVDGFYNRMGAVMADARSDELIGRSPWDVLSTVGKFRNASHQRRSTYHLGR